MVNKYNEGEVVYYKGYPFVVLDWNRNRTGYMYKLSNGKWKPERTLKGEYDAGRNDR